MKPLTIEEKAQRYNKVLECARKELQTCGSSDCDIAKQIFRFFPELAESEDERIRKEILNFVRGWLECHDKPNAERDERYESWITWLEKQGEESNNVYDKELSEILGCVIHRYINDPNIPYTERENVSMKIIPYVERLEKQSKKKLAEKVEPNFHEGDWVVYNNDICQIVKREEGCNKLVTVFGIEKELVNERNLSTARLWTIEDAKNGDVLVNWNNTVFIFKAIEDETVKFYIAYNEEWDAIKTPSTKLSHLGLPEPQFEFHPATKEQRDTLIKATTDAGYTFDFEKKELKKIVTPIFNIGDRVRYKGHVCDGVITEITDTDYICRNAKLPISTQDKLELVEQKSYWSEEDERIYQSIMDDTVQENQLNDKQTNWLRDIKYRYFQQSKQEWSEGQMKVLDIAISLNRLCALEEAELRNLLEQLKQL